MANTGIAPYDPSTPVGQMRIITGDVNYVDAGGGNGTYNLFSDVELEGFLALANNELLRSAGFAYMALAGVAAVDAKSVKDYDLSVDLRSRADKLREQAIAYFKQADERDVRDGVFDVFELTRTGRDYTDAELAERENWLWYL